MPQLDVGNEVLGERNHSTVAAFTWNLRAGGGGGYGGGYGGGGGGYGGGARGGTYATTRRRPTPPRTGLHMFVAGFTFATNERVRQHTVPAHSTAPPAVAAAG